MRNRLIILLSICSLLPFLSVAQKDSLCIAFYNCENYFDSFRDSTINDAEYTPDGKRFWTYSRFINKRNNLFKVFAAMGRPEPPEIIGLCELENKFVVNQLAYETPLSKYQYGVVHENSSDRRGIDVALIYRKDRVRLVGYDYYNPRAIEPSLYTRSILHAKFLWGKFDTLHVFVNHFPSKLGGSKGDRSRMLVAGLLKSKLDSVARVNPKASIIVTGDFNDVPDSDAMKVLDDENLMNMALPLQQQGKGSLRYNGEWELIDQFVVSKSLETGATPVKIKGGMHIYSSPFLFEEDQKYGGQKPLRTFYGFKYLNGYSDHLPVFIELERVL